MYPTRELIRLAAHKAALRRDIAIHRAECAEAAAELARPFEWLDRALAWWRKVSPIAKLAAIPLGGLASRMIFKRLKIIGPLVRWGPTIFNLVRGFSAGAKMRS